MLRSYLKTAFRNFWKSKGIALINIVGLCVGISAALVVYLIVQYDFSFDKFEPDRDRIYRVVSEAPEWQSSGVPAPLHLPVQTGVSGIAATAAFFSCDDPYSKVSIPQGNDKPLRVFNKQERVVFAGKGYFDIFPHQWLAGNAAASLKNPYQVVLSESRSRLYFPGIPVSSVVGRTILFNDTIATTVSGIVKDLVAPTDFDNKVFIALSTIPNSALRRYFNWDQWGNTSSISQLFVKLAPNASPAQVNRQIAAIFKAQQTGDEQADKTVHRLQPLNDIHFNQKFGGPASKSVLRNLGLLAIFLLLLGAINFINLSTAQATQRAREVGVRKTLGGSWGQLTAQFLSEAFLLTFFATVLSVLITPVLLNVFGGYMPEGLQYKGVLQPHILLFLAALVVGVTLLAGFYPALILSRFRPALALKNQFSSHTADTRSARMRKMLIVTQFVIAQVFIIGMLVVNKQLRYSLQKDMGFRKEAVINFDAPFDFFHPDSKRAVLLNKLRAIPGVQAASLGGNPPVMNGYSATEIKYNNGKEEVSLGPDSRFGDTAFLGLYHIGLLAGRNILPSDSITELLVNETLAHSLGFQQPRDALGKTVEMNDWQLTIVGVMADFNQASVRTAIHPMIFFNAGPYGHTIHVALQPQAAAWEGTIAKIKKAWKDVYPGEYFDYSFLDKTVENMYRQDQRISRLLGWSAGIAIFISCLGLLGLVIFTANQRIKEIGIRKVLGASVVQIISLLSRDFIRLVALAFVIAAPIAWWFTHKWLQNFAYHTTLSWWIFIVSGTAMLFLALVILCIRAGRAAMVNPVKSLRTE